MPELTTDTVNFELSDRIATVTLNRPEAMNALDPETIASLAEIWVEIRDNPDIWVGIVTGAGERAFCAGADLKKTIPTRPGTLGVNWPVFQPSLRNTIDGGMQIWKPMIAAVNGYCLAAGLTLLSACDLRIAAEHAQFGLPEVIRGIVPTLGATQRLTRQLPWSAAMELLLMGEHIDAQRAYEIGLVNRVVPADEVIPTARAWAEKLTAGAPLTQRAIKEAAVRGLSLPIDEGIRMEELLSAHIRKTEDFKEGPRAFAEKRPPIYGGN
ncbi:MAG: enoyl-CoA hydratase/isomerase family protein [Chloroflexi bacterium]|nr:enoyl-CoA hydratase/isomerase family protein [Chloroflexota bacterium]MYF81366.1 enoyl-CoA hydratase/isomerase family protein [Chloroflexota bacterium]MYI04968.1 enoyl-CoA hydratase/isomerase family protein [Chloroflexota bacterium]